MARLNETLLGRVDQFCDRILDVVDALEGRRARQRLLDQMSASGTSVGANIYEAAEAISRPDFCKCLGIAVKELSESRFWIRLVGGRGWIKPARLRSLETESIELAKIMGTMIARSRTVTGRSRR